MAKKLLIITEYEEKYIGLLLDHGNCGYSPDTFAGAYCIDPVSIDSWRKTYLDFDTAYKLASVSQLHYWQKELRDGTGSGDKLRVDAAKTMLMQLSRNNALNRVKEYVYNFGGNKANESKGDVDLAKELKQLLDGQPSI